jgi:hypothetical protein
MKQLISAAAMGAVVLALATSSAMALTFKKGQVLGSDGKIYDGASPEETARLIKNAADGGESAGVRGNSLFVVMDDELVFIPLSDLSGKTKETRMDIVKAHVIANATDLDVDDLQEEAGNLEAVLESRLAGIEAGIEAGLSATEAVDLDNALATAMTASEQVAAQSALEEALEAADGVDAEVEALFEDSNSVFDGEGNYVGNRDEMCASGELSDCLNRLSLT